jgi:MFS family permease
LSPIIRAADRTFGSLRVRNFKLFISGQMVSVTGTWMQTVALGWLVLEMTGSGVAVGVLLALQFTPMLLLGLWGGVFADGHDKRRTLMATQLAMASVAAALWAVTWSGVATLWIVYGLVLLQGLITVIDNPTRQTFVPEMVGKDLVANAVGLNSAVFNAARIVGPSVAGLIIATVGTEWAFLVNTFTFAAVLFALKAMDPEQLSRAPRTARSSGQIRAGLAYVWKERQLRYTILTVAVFSLFALNFSVLLPLMARYTFDRGAGAFGFLTSMMALGAVIGALVSAARRRPTKRVLVGSIGIFGVLALVASAAPSLPVFAVLLIPIGAASITFISTANATLQLNSDPTMRGRVMALHGLVFLGSTPLGSPLIGWIAEVFGPRVGLGLGGAVSLATAGVAVLVLKRGQIEKRLRLMIPALARTS